MAPEAEFHALCPNLYDWTPLHARGYVEFKLRVRGQENVTHILAPGVGRFAAVPFGLLCERPRVYHRGERWVVLRWADGTAVSYAY